VVAHDGGIPRRGRLLIIPPGEPPLDVLTYPQTASVRGNVQTTIQGGLDLRKEGVRLALCLEGLGPLLVRSRQQAR